MAKPVDEALTTYRAKRRFAETTEPAGGSAGNAAGALYLIQKHDATRLHYDFRLELDGVLLSWAVTRGPSYNTRDKRLAVRTEDHPLEYGSFEGTIPKGNYGGGTVMLWDSGTWSPIGNAHEALKAGKIAFNLQGERLQGRWALVRMRPDAGRNPRENWLLIKEKDEYANTRPDILDADTSVTTGRTLAQIAAPGLPAFCEPALATLVDEAPNGDGWSFEIKYDGYRALIAADGAAVKIYTRSGLDWTSRFPQIAKAAAKLNLKAALIDSEIAVVDAHGKTDFGALVAALESGKVLLSCFAFDLLFDGGKDIRHLPLKTRKQHLKTILGAPARDAPIQYSEDFSGTDKAGAKLAKTACAHGLEGIIAKDVNAPYRSGRQGDWLKIKCGHAQEFVIIGFSPSTRGRPFASLLLAVNDHGQLRYAGRVGSGFTDASLTELAAFRTKYKTTKPAVEVPAAMAKNAAWVRPVLIAEIEFAGWTPDNILRHGRFKDLRGDKPAKDVVKEMPKPAIKLTHPERVLYPQAGVTKGELAAYLQTAAGLMMPYVTGRFVSLVRAPDGVAKKSFFQRHISPGFGGWQEQDFVNKTGKHEAFMFCKTPEAVLRAVQMGVLEFHIWGSTIEAVETPDRIVFDLDPDDAVTFDAVKDAALRLRDVLEALDLQSLPLLSGGKGIHVVVPVQPHYEWPVVKEFSANLAKRVAEDAPDKFVATMTKAKRKNKIFIDHFRNEKGSTAIAPYSPRAREGAAVAWPLSWAALDGTKAANAVSIRQAAEAVAAGENDWAGYAGISQKLQPAVLRALGVDV